MSRDGLLLNLDNEAIGEKPRAIGDWVYDNVRRFLSEGNIRPGDKLKLQLIADRLGVSQTPVREALLRLAQEDLVMPAGRGFTVPRLSVADFENLFELRRVLEPHAFAHVAAGGDAGGMRESLATGIEADAIGNVAAFARANTEFRRAWFSKVRNPKMVTAIRLYDDHFIHLRRLTHMEPDVRTILLKGHEELVKSVETRDEAAAFAAMNRNLDQAQAAMRKVLDRQDER